MALLDIITVPDPILRRKSAPVERVDAELKRLIDDMFETMYAAPGIGLAGIQVVVPRRVVVIDVTRDENEPPQPFAMINPEILRLGDETAVYEEGCLSIPEVYAEIERPAGARVRYTDREGEIQEMDCDGILATVVQHEIDHLDGKLFIDFLSRLRRDRIIKKFVKAQRSDAAVG